MAIRSDPSSAHGYAPAELLLGRKLIYPIELSKSDIDLSGNFCPNTFNYFENIELLANDSLFIFGRGLMGNTQ